MRRLFLALCLFLPLIGCDYEPIFAQEYPLKVLEIQDGDTITAEIDLGFDTFIKRKIRIKDVDVWESGDRRGQIVTEEEKAKGREAREFLKDKIATAKSITIKRPTRVVYTYDRIVGVVFIDGVSVAEIMKPYQRVPTPKKKAKSNGGLTE